jgi:glycosyl-4,4'-diaponeurosporenoate acyltransferase
MTTFFVNVVAWVAAGAIVGTWRARQSLERVARVGTWTRLRAFERSGELYVRVFRVRAWKRLVPEAGTWFGGMSKRRLPGVHEGGLQRLAVESLRAEKTHLTMLAVTPVFVLWNDPLPLLANVCFSLVVNVPPIVVTRFNRHRLARLA